MSATYNKFVEKNIRTAWVKTWTVDFLQGLEQQATKTDIEAYCKEQLEAFKKACQEKAAKRAKVDTVDESEHGWKQSSVSNMSGIRKAIEAWSESQELTDANSYPQDTKTGAVTQHLALLYMKFPQEHNQSNIEAKQERKNEQRRNLESIDCIDEYRVMIEKMLASFDHRVLAAGLIAATGRRPSEIYKTAEFKQVGQFEVMFSGQAKTRGEKREAYPTYTLVESAKVINALAKLRRHPETKKLQHRTLAQIDSGRNNKMNHEVKTHFTHLIKPPHGEEELSAKNLRASYAAIAIHLFCPWQMSTNLFIKERLGHTSDATATAYEDYQITDKEGKPLTRGAWLDRLSEPMDAPSEAETVQARVRMTKAAQTKINDQNFLPFTEQVARMEELVRLAEIGKQFEEGKLVQTKTVLEYRDKIVEKVIEVEKIVEKIVEVPVEKIIEKIVEVFVEKTPQVSEELNTEIAKEQPEVTAEIEAVVKAEQPETQPESKPQTITEQPKMPRKQTKETQKITKERVKKDPTELANKDLFGSHTPNTGEEKIRRAVAAIKAYNEAQYDRKNMWAINTNTLKDLTNCRTAIVQRYLESDEGRLLVTDYNKLNEFSFQHNRGRGSICNFIKLETVQVNR